MVQSSSMHITDSQLRDALRDLAAELDKTPTYKEMNEQGAHSASTCRQRFGSWNKAVEAAGLEPNRKHDSLDLTNDQLLEILRKRADRLGRTPTQDEMDAFGSPTAGTYDYRFGSWNDAVEEAGLEPNRKKATPYDDEKLLDDLRRLAEQLGKTPTFREMRDHGNHSPKTYTDHFGSWNGAIEEAGLEVSYGQGSPVPEDPLLDEIRRLADELDKTPSTGDLREHGQFSLNPFQNQFGSWNEAVEAAGLEPNPTPKMATHRHSSIPTDTLIETLQQLALHLGRPPTQEDVREYTDIPVEVYTERWSSWWVAQSMAQVTATDLGLDPDRELQPATDS